MKLRIGRAAAWGVSNVAGDDEVACCDKSYVEMLLELVSGRKMECLQTGLTYDNNYWEGNYSVVWGGEGGCHAG